MLTLARSRLGRVLLHLLAMVGDRAVRFHAAGIVRELAWMERMTMLLNRVRIRLAGGLARYLAQPVRHYSPATTADPQSLSELLLPGDVLLTDGNTRIAALVKRITGSGWSHVSMYVGPLEEGPDPLCIVEADIAAGVRAVRLSELRGLHVRALRPTGLNEPERRRLADGVVTHIGAEYDLALAWALAGKLLLPLAPRLPMPPTTMAQSATRFVCSTLLAQAFMLVGYPITPVQIAVRDPRAADHRYVTPRDFESASVFEVVGQTGQRARNAGEQLTTTSRSSSGTLPPRVESGCAVQSTQRLPTRNTSAS